MKKYLLAFLLSLLMATAFSQPKPKPKEKPPTQKEMGDMMKEMQEAMKDMDPENKKLMDSMGIKMPSMKDIPKVSDKQLAEAFEDEIRVVPKRDATRISAVPKKVTDANLKGYLSALQKKITETVSPETRSAGEKVFSYIKANSKNGAEAGNMAAAFWIAGKSELAIHMMSKVCTGYEINSDNLSNYASMLSMMNAQHLAIPILNNLNSKFPNNSTILNNLGQAWFGLGEISKAEKYLDSAIRLFTYHPQANLTKAAIEESKGNIPKAVEALKRSIKHSYTNEKEDMLRKHGHKLKLGDLRIPFKPGPDPLGLERFKRPDYPKTLNELKSLKPLWQNFNSECDNKLAQIQNERSAIAEKYAKDLASRKLGHHIPLHIKKATLQLEAITGYHEKRMLKLGELHQAAAADLEIIKKTHKRAVPEAPCEAHVAAENDYLTKYNERKKDYDEQALQIFKRYFNDLAYWSQYTSTDKNQFDLIVLDFQEGWLKKLKEHQPLLSSGFEYLDCIEKKDSRFGKLSDFDVVACNYNDTLDLKVITFIQNCSRMTSKLNVKIIEYSRFDDFTRAEGDTYMSSSIKISVEQGFEALKYDKGPLKLEAKVGASMEIELDRQGIKDIILGLEAKGGAGHNLYDKGLEEFEGTVAGKDVIDTTLEIGVEGRFSLISGKGRLGGSGLLDKITFTEW